MKYIVLALVMIGCGDGLTNDVVEECNLHDEGYSHTVVFCGGMEPENAVQAFTACNVRKPRSEQYEGCISNVDLMEVDPGCEMRHICMTPWTEDK